MTALAPQLQSLRSAPVPIAPAAYPVLQTPSTSSALKPKPVELSRDTRTTRGRRERPCDACRRRKSKCVINEGQKNCAACGMHKQECTYMQDPQPRKRKQDGDVHQGAQVKQRNTEYNAPLWNSFGEARTIKKEKEASVLIARGIGRTNTYPSSDFHPAPSFAFHLDIPSKLEPALYNVWQPTSAPALDQNFHIQERPIPKLVEPTRVGAPASTMQKLDLIVGSRGPSLIQVYRDTVHLSFPIVQDDILAAVERDDSNSIDPMLLAAIYSVAASLEVPHTSDESTTPIDVLALENLALQLFKESLSEPALSTLQAGLLLTHSEEVDPISHGTQITEMAYELGIQLDCSTWTLSPAERGLRKILAGAVYMQDTWIALVSNSPPTISRSSWALQGLEPQDYVANQQDSQTLSIAVERGRLIYSRMIELTDILSSILDTFYSTKAAQKSDEIVERASRAILEKAKPIQIRLREWCTRLDPWLKMDGKSTDKPFFSGYLHLAYFATEISLHRCIVQSLSAKTDERSLVHICRSAAKTRLISALDFVNRLRPEHLTSFWYFPSKEHFASIGTFGSLLEATSICQAEADFYHSRLIEYRWTLSVSTRNASFLKYAIDTLDASLKRLRNLPRKASIPEDGYHHLVIGDEPGVSPLFDVPVTEMPTFHLEHLQSSNLSGLVSPSTSASGESEGNGSDK